MDTLNYVLDMTIEKRKKILEESRQKLIKAKGKNIDIRLGDIKNDKNMLRFAGEMKEFINETKVCKDETKSAYWPSPIGDCKCLKGNVKFELKVSFIDWIREDLNNMPKTKEIEKKLLDLEFADMHIHDTKTCETTREEEIRLEKAKIKLFKDLAKMELEYIA